MKPETIRRLKENIPELRELIAFLQSEADKLDKLSNMGAVTDNSDAAIATEVVGRLRAKQTIDAMLAPLLQDVDKPVGTNPADYMVE